MSDDQEAFRAAIIATAKATRDENLDDFDEIVRVTGNAYTEARLNGASCEEAEKAGLAAFDAYEAQRKA